MKVGDCLHGVKTHIHTSCSCHLDRLKKCMCFLNVPVCVRCALCVVSSLECALEDRMTGFYCGFEASELYTYVGGFGGILNI